MRGIVVVLILVLALPVSGFAGRGGYGYGPPSPPPGYDGPPPSSRHDRHFSRHDHGDAWVPLAIFGGILGLVALSQMEPAFSPPRPPQRICRDTYNYYDEYGNYLYSRYVDRPCRD